MADIVIGVCIGVVGSLIRGISLVGFVIILVIIVVVVAPLLLLLLVVVVVVVNGGGDNPTNRPYQQAIRIL